MIQVFTCLTGNSAPYAENLRENLSTERRLIKFSAIADHTFQGKTTWDIKEVVPRIYPNGAANHGQMLNRITKHIDDDAKIIIIADVDIMVICKLWDEYIDYILSKHGAIISPKFSGASGPFFCVFPSWLYKAVSPDWMPGSKENGYLTETDQIDTGWRLEHEFKKYNPLYLKYADRLRDGSNLNYMYYIEDPIFKHDEPFMSHMGGSNKHNFESEKAQNWINAIKNFDL